uniref:J domain-containing protein n=1 Tax=Chenopodium quinoa TaxID=63459 RepID=A0A803MM89_CHEQI
MLISICGVSITVNQLILEIAVSCMWLQWHPDVSKDSRAGEVFKSIHLAYQVLSNEATKVQYDRVLKSGMHTSNPVQRNTYQDFEFENEFIMHRWSELRQKMRNDRYRKDMMTADKVIPLTTLILMKSLKKRLRKKGAHSLKFFSLFSSP